MLLACAVRVARKVLREDLENEVFLELKVCLDHVVPQVNPVLKVNVVQTVDQELPAGLDRLDPPALVALKEHQVPRAIVVRKACPAFLGQ